MSDPKNNPDNKLINAFADELAKGVPDTKYIPTTVKRPPKYGVFLRWPEAGDAWIHPDDLELAKSWIPGNRILRRIDLDDFWSELSYGNERIRVRPAMWQLVETDGYELDDPIEVSSSGGKDEPVIGRISEIRWNQKSRQIEYTIQLDGHDLPKKFHADQFHMVKDIERPMSFRQMQMIERAKLR